MKQVVVVDACALILALESPSQDQARISRQEKARFEIAKLVESGAEFIIPAPVFAELYAGGPDGEKVAEALIKRQLQLRVDAYEIEAARLSGKITAGRLAGRGSVSRTIVKFDAMIVAAAARAGATHILTADSDIGKCVAHLASSQQPQVIDLN